MNVFNLRVPQGCCEDSPGVSPKTPGDLCHDHFDWPAGTPLELSPGRKGKATEAYPPSDQERLDENQVEQLRRSCTNMSVQTFKSDLEGIEEVSERESSADSHSCAEFSPTSQERPRRVTQSSVEVELGISDEDHEQYPSYSARKTPQRKKVRAKTWWKVLQFLSMLLPTVTFGLLVRHLVVFEPHLILMVSAGLSALTALCFGVLAKAPPCARRQELKDREVILDILRFCDVAYFSTMDEMLRLMADTTVHERVRLHDFSNMASNWMHAAAASNCPVAPDDRRARLAELPRSASAVSDGTSPYSSEPSHAYDAETVIPVSPTFSEDHSPILVKAPFSSHPTRPSALHLDMRSRVAIRRSFTGTSAESTQSGLGRGGDSAPESPWKTARSADSETIAWRTQKSLGDESAVKRILKKSMSSISRLSDMSASSFTDFNRRRAGVKNMVFNDALHRNEAARRQGSFASDASAEGFSPGLEASPSQLFLEFNLPEQELPVPNRDSLKSRLGFRFRTLTSGSTLIGKDSASDSGKSYSSICDAVLGDATNQETGEIVSAEIANVRKGPNGMNQIRVSFKSRCLRTQNVWQRSLLDQQKALLNAVNTQLVDTRRELQKIQDTQHVREDQKELLRSFRKIIDRKFDGTDDMTQHVVVIIIEEVDLLRTAAQDLCRDLEYNCHTFSNVDEGDAELRKLLSAAESDKGNVVSLGSPLEIARSSDLVPLALVGASFLHLIPPEWRNMGIVVALTSDPQDFEEVGRSLLASGEAEIRERLRARGISEFLMHPLSMSSLRGAVLEMLQKKVGEQYLLLETLGRGAFAVVYRVKRLSDGSMFAMKEVSLKRMQKMRQLSRAPSSLNLDHVEPQTLWTLDWPTVISLKDWWTSDKDCVQYLLMPVLEGGNLQQQIVIAEQSETPVPPELWIEWYAQAIHAVTYLHWSGVLHRDLKPANFLIGADLRNLQVGDLGSAVRLPPHPRKTGPRPAPGSSVPGTVTTVSYTGPEVFREQVFYPASDMWSIGICFYEVLMLKKPHTLPEKCETDWKAVDPNILGSDAFPVLQAKIADGTIEETFANELLDLLSADPAVRPAAAKLMEQHHIRKCLERVLVECEIFSAEGLLAQHLGKLDQILNESGRRLPYTRQATIPDLMLGNSSPSSPGCSPRFQSV